MVPRLRMVAACWVAILPWAIAPAAAHDGTSYAGIYRSRDMGASWLGVDVGLFLRSAASAAVDPGDSAHLLLGTDTGLLRSRNGGRQWSVEAEDLILGPVTAVAFAED